MWSHSFQARHFPYKIFKQILCSDYVSKKKDPLISEQHTIQATTPERDMIAFQNEVFPNKNRVWPKNNPRLPYHKWLACVRNFHGFHGLFTSIWGAFTFISRFFTAAPCMIFCLEVCFDIPILKMVVGKELAEYDQKTVKFDWLVAIVLVLVRFHNGRVV